MLNTAERPKWLLRIKLNKAARGFEVKLVEDTIEDTLVLNHVTKYHFRRVGPAVERALRARIKRKLPRQ